MMAAWKLIVLWRKPILILMALVLLVLGYRWWEHRVEARGYAQAEAKWVEREARITSEAKDKYTEKLELALTKQKVLQSELDEQVASRDQWEKQHETAAQKRVAAALAGTERLRIDIRTARDALSGVAQGSVAGAGAAPGPAETAELMPEVAAAVLRIAGDAAGDVRDYNDLLARYRSVETACK